MSEFTPEQWPRGRRVVGVRGLTNEELVEEGWEDWGNQGTSVLVFDDGSVLYPSRDSEGNGPGVLYGRLPDGTTVCI